jgi:hypothetical protein
MKVKQVSKFLESSYRMKCVLNYLTRLSVKVLCIKGEVHEIN